jgi:tetratricopeptide (TPR) repeat protein
MKIISKLSALLFLCSSLGYSQQNGAPQPAPYAASVPSPLDATVTKKEAGDVNAQLVAARAATAKKDYAESERLMLPVTRANPLMVLPWVELGIAQSGLGKDADAEKDFKIALGIDPASVALAHNEDFYQAPDAPGQIAAGATRASRNTAGGGVATTAEKRTPDVEGTVYASLGEIYIREKKIPDAIAAYDSAVKAYPQSAASYRHNETIFLFKAGDATDQLTAANQAIALAPTRADNYYFKAQALVSNATLDPKTQKMILPAECSAAYQKYLELDPSGQYSADAKSILAAAGLPAGGKK